MCLEKTIIQAVDLSYANLKKTKLGETNFNETILEGADFRGANFCQTFFPSATFDVQILAVQF